ncbi:glycosyltransferase family 2 protein, partial [Pseudomonas sp. SZ57]|uniref:glycosyltransferase family 2 protein n=1 Tax=Pseudomonas sp. SZ57 TaxID=2662259 RepID=UPI001C49C66B
HYEAPAVSVIIPVGPGHGRYLIDALDSLIAQDTDSWECIVVNDSGEPIDTRGHAWAHVVDGLQLGAGNARNIGVEVSRAPLLC